MSDRKLADRRARRAPAKIYVVIPDVGPWEVFTTLRAAKDDLLRFGDGQGSVQTYDLRPTATGEGKATKDGFESQCSDPYPMGENAPTYPQRSETGEKL